MANSSTETSGQPRFLFYGQGGGSLPLQVHRAVHGDFAPLVQMAIEQRLAIDDILAMGLFFSVTCAEDLPYITERMIGENTPGTFLGDYRIRQQKEACKLWPKGKVPADVLGRASVQGLDTSCVENIYGPVTFLLP